MSLDRVSDPVKRLATVVSLAARIEPELLRAARLRLLPDVDVGAEADLWFSDLVAARSTRRIVLEAEVASTLQVLLGENRELMDAAREIIATMHASAPAAIQLEEELTYLALAGGGVEETINTKLTAVLSAIANEGRSGLVDWAARALPRMPAMVAQTKAAAALRLVTGGASAEPELHVRREVIDDPALAALVERALPKTVVYARLVPEEHGLAVEIGRTATPASHPIELPKTEPLVLELTTAHQAEVVEVPRKGTVTRPIAHDVSIRTIARDVYRLEEQLEPHAMPIRFLLLTRLAMGEVRFDIPEVDAVLIAGDVTEAATAEEYARMGVQLNRWFLDRPVFPVPGPHDLLVRHGMAAVIEPFVALRERFGMSAVPALDYANTVTIGGWTVGLAGINTAYGEDAWAGSFESAQIVQACGGDPATWCRSHDLSILVMHHAPQHLGLKSRERWEAFRAGEIFDLIVCGSSSTDLQQLHGGAMLVGTPQFTNPEGPGYVTLEVKRDGESLLVTMQREWTEPHEQQMRLPVRRPIAIDHTRVPRARVLVAGIAEQLSVPVQELCRVVGGMLALQGHELLTGGWPGVDYLVAEGFERVAPDRADAISHYMPEGKRPDYPRGRKVIHGSDQDALTRAVEAADVVILIEGASGTLSVGREALRQRKPLIPVGAGAAADIRDDTLPTWPHDARKRLQRLANRSGIAATVGVVRELIADGWERHERTSEPPERKRVFLSYDAGDRKFAEELRRTIEMRAEVEFWHEERAGSLPETRSAIRSAAAAVIFLSASYLESKTTTGFELRTIVDAALENRLPLVWFVARPCAWQSSPIAAFQAAHDPARPLRDCDPQQRAEIYASVAERLWMSIAGLNDAAR